MILFYFILLMVSTTISSAVYVFLFCFAVLVTAVAWCKKRISGPVVETCDYWTAGVIHSSTGASLGGGRVRRVRTPRGRGRDAICARWSGANAKKNNTNLFGVTRVPPGLRDWPRDYALIFDTTSAMVVAGKKTAAERKTKIEFPTIGNVYSRPESA